MSYDRQIDQICPHYVVQEALFPGADNQTIYPLRPIATIASVSIRIDGCTDVPPQGVQLPAQAVGGVVGPFTIVTGVNDTLIAKVNQGPLQTVVLPAQTQITADQVAFALNSSLQGVYFSSSNGAVQFTTTTEGVNTSVLFATGSTLCASIG